MRAILWRATGEHFSNCYGITIGTGTGVSLRPFALHCIGIVVGLRQNAVGFRDHHEYVTKDAGKDVQ